MSWADDYDRATELGKQRNGAHPTGTPRLYDDPNVENVIGVRGEFAFARAFALHIDEQIRPAGDNGVDFRVTIAGREITIDVKTAQRAPYLLVKEHDIGRCADWIVLACFDRGAVSFIGWETRAVMSLMPVASFGAGIRSHFRARDQLRPMGQLVDLMALRDTPTEPH